jgi:hypothetical protein
VSLRFFVVGLCWLAVMLLLFTTPLPKDHPIYFGWIPARALIHGILFWGFTQIWNVALKKQMKYELVRDKSFLIVGAVAAILIVFSEFIGLSKGMPAAYFTMNALFDFVGCGLGILTFRLVYAGSY